MPFTPVRKPPPGTKVNWGHPLATGLSICFPMNEGGGGQVLDVVGGVVGAFAGTTLPVWKNEIDGPSVHFSHGTAAATFIDCGTPTSAQDVARLNSSGGPVGSSWFIRFLWDDSNNANGGLCERNDVNTVNAGWFIGFDNTGGSPLCALQEFSTTNQRDDFFVPVVNTWYDLLVTKDQSATSVQWVAYLNGVKQTSTNVATGSGTSGSDAPQHLYIGRESFQSASCWAGLISTVAIWKGRILTLADAQLLHKDPWAYMQPRPNQRYFFAPAASIISSATTQQFGASRGYQLVYRDPSGRRALRWTPDNSRLGDDQMPWAKRLNRSYEPEYLDGQRLGKWTPDNVFLSNDQVPWIKRLRPYEPEYLDGQRLGRWTPDASFLGGDQIPWVRKLNRNYEPIYEDGARLGRWIPPNVIPAVVEDMSWSRMRRGYEPVYEDGQRLGRYPHSQVIFPKTFAAQMLLRSAVLGREIFITLKATKATYAGSLTAILAGNSKTFAATAAQKAGSLNRKIFIGAQLNATKAFYQGSLSMKVTHGPPPPPTCIPAACTTIPTIVSHHAICELPGS